jgi:sugar-specific transcriptional regulator TrmB
MENINEILKDLGFEDREIKIYLALIKHNGLTALQISKEARIDRTTTYDVLEKLIDKGIVSVFVKNKVKNYSALKPKELLVHYKEKYFALEKILPELNNFTTKEKTIAKCELFQGKEGLKYILKDLISSKLDYKAIGIRDEYEAVLGYLVDQGILTLNDFKVKETAIVENGVKFTKVKNGVYRYLDKNILPPTTTLIYGKTVVFFIWKEPYMAVKIENHEIAKTQEEYFNLLWKIAKS